MQKTVAEDAGVIARHRKAMFADMGGTEDSVLETMRLNCEPWLKRMMTEGKYLGWILYDGEAPVASAGMLLLDWPPGPFDPTGQLRGYLLNVFVDPAYRRRGLARELVKVCMQEALRRGIRALSLHASDKGRPLYEALGFSANNEMLFRAPDNAPAP